MMNEQERVNEIMSDVEEREKEASEAYEINREYNEETANVERIVSNKMNAIDQLETTSNYVPVEIDADWTLAYHVYQFLIGKTNKLPAFEYIDKIKSEADKNSKLISMGYGIIIDNKLTISCTEIITEKKERTDIIKADNYYATIGNPDSSREGTSYSIDVKEYPLYDERRVKYLQQYLDNYLAYEKQNNNTNVR